MRHLKITHQGKVYEVDVEESGVVVSAAAPAVPAAAPAPVPTPAAAPAQPIAGPGLEIEAPMSGRIAKIFVKPGDAVEEGDRLFILEAMKLENAIYADESGVIKQIFVTQNQIVNTSDVLAVIG